MEWVLQSPQIHTTFGNLGFAHGDGYHINENCNAALETILHNILIEDKYLRTYRRSISFGQNIDKDLIPLLLHAKNDKTIEILVKVLVDLTIPIECLLSVEVISKTEYGRHTIFEINNLLSTAKAAFADQRATKAIIEFLKRNYDGEQKKLTEEQCTNISNSLLLLRNILHIPEEISNATSGYNGLHTIQNQILWNTFSQSIDKILLKLMTIPEAFNWGVTMIQLIALLYKDQHVVTLHKLLNIWLETSLTESSEDNESNTSPPDRGSEDSSPMLTSDPTSDSSDTGASGKSNDELNSMNNVWELENGNQQFASPSPDTQNQHEAPDKGASTPTSTNETEKFELSDNSQPNASSDVQSSEANVETGKQKLISENSDCGYGTQIENQESISTSSNDDELPFKKPVHQKPHNPKQRVNTKVRTAAATSLQDKKRKKLVKRGKTNIINVQGLSHKTPTDDDISNILKEFTVDFLLKGYNHLVQTLHSQILTNMQLEIDISHFLWLVTYFLKFATQIELDLEHVNAVLSYDVISFMTAEGVNLCEQFELAIKLDGGDLKPSLRRLHLVVTAIREYVQAIDMYKKFSHIRKEDHDTLISLQLKMCETEELRSLLVLLLRYYNPKYHTKQYLQDLIVTNHLLLIFLDDAMKFPEYKGSTNMTDHIKQFATPEIMYQYGLLLDDYESNGEFVNDCIFTMMHHVGGEIGSLISLFQPNILKTFTSIWKTEFEICDDWSDLIEYVINTFIKKPHTLQIPANVWIDNERFEVEEVLPIPLSPPSSITKSQLRNQKLENKLKEMAKVPTEETISSTNRWTEEEISSLNWKFIQCSSSPNAVDEIIKLFKEDGINKSRESVLRELYKQNLINKDDYESASKGESERTSANCQAAKEWRDDEIAKFCEQLKQDGKVKFLDWVQEVLLDTCFAKIYLRVKSEECSETGNKKEEKLLTFELFKRKEIELPVMSPVSYHSLVCNRSVPLVPWNCGQAAICKDLKFLQLLHKLGFHMPVDTGKVFIRIPHFWTDVFLYEIASKVAPVDTAKLRFSLSDIKWSSASSSRPDDPYLLPPTPPPRAPLLPADTLYQIHKQKHLAMVNYMPMPGSSFNTDSEEINKMNWLQLVQKSQECKLSLTMRSAVDAESECESALLAVEPPAAPPFDIPAPAGPASAPAPAPAPAGAAPKQNCMPYPALPSPAELECNNSICETASVASDLTRMYVSDEDDRTEVRAARPVRTLLPMDDLDDIDDKLPVMHDGDGDDDGDGDGDDVDFDFDEELDESEGVEGCGGEGERPDSSMADADDDALADDSDCMQ